MGISYEPTNDRRENVARSILDQLGKRLMKKQIDVFPSTKNFKFKLAYYEADALEGILRAFLLKKVNGLEESHYHSMAMVADEINQKLA